MEVSGKLNLFVGKVGDRKFFSASLSKPNADGTHQNARIDVHLAESGFPKEKVEKLEEGKCYKFDDCKGFLSASEYDSETHGHVQKPIVILTAGRVVEIVECKARTPVDNPADVAIKKPKTTKQPAKNVDLLSSK